MRLSRERITTLTIGAGSVIAMVLFWWLAAATFLHGHSVPTPWSVLTEFHRAGFGFYRDSFTVTLREAGLGYLWGVGIALGLAVVVMLVPWLEPVIMQAAVITYCVPLVVLAPLLIVCQPLPAHGGNSPTAVDLAALMVIFTTAVGAVLGFRAADQASVDVVHVFGGGAGQQFLRVRLISAIPALFSTLQIAAPAAFLGALLGEWFDRHLEIGVGPSLYLALNNLDTSLAWSMGLLCAAVSGVAYGVIGLIGRLAAPWARGEA